MEELQSTEILDREILEDARKKAFKILKTADEDIKAKAADWERKAKFDLDDLRRKFAEQGKTASVEILARLPMDKRRVKAQTLERLLSQAVKVWYAGLGRGRVLELLRKELQTLLVDCMRGEHTPSLQGGVVDCDEFSLGKNSPNAASPKSGQVGGQVLYHGLTETEARGLVQPLLPVQNFSFSEAVLGGAFPELVIENKAVRVRASINQAVDFFLSEKRAELVSALLGEHVLDEGQGEELW